MIKISVFDRNYEKVAYETILEKNVSPPMSDNPFKHKLFNNDTFTYDNTNNKINIVHSPLRSQKDIPAVIILDGNKTYGRKKDKLLYRCIPNDITIPSFLVPYDTKSLPFSKVMFNAYVTISFVSWTEKEKHPFGVLSQFIGCVFNRENFYEYQIYCRGLNDTLQKTIKDTSKSLEKYADMLDGKEIVNKYPQIEKRINMNEWFVFTIDPSGSTDLDDAYSIKTINKDKGQYMISIYIPNVPIYIDILNLWGSLSDRVSTIYLPNKKRPMLPPILSDSIISLLENSKPKCAFTMDIYITNSEVVDIQFKTTLVKISKNYEYEEKNLLKNTHYQLLFDITTSLFKSNKHKYIDQIKDSHDLVAYLMILMNYKCGVRLKEGRGGIFRATVSKTVGINDKSSMDECEKNGDNLLNKVDKDVSNFLKIWNSSTSGSYVLYSDIQSDDELYHHILNLEAYIHITSPIRRLVDILNMTQFIKMYDMLDLSESAYDFYTSKCEEMNDMNTKMKQIRKIQTECELLNMLNTNIDLLTKQYKGYNFTKKPCLKSAGFFEYSVYLPELKIVTKLVCESDMEDYDINMYSLYLFEDENRFNKKIRVSLCK
jgi:exoribonuclease R